MQQLNFVFFQKSMDLFDRLYGAAEGFFLADNRTLGNANEDEALRIYFWVLVILEEPFSIKDLEVFHFDSKKYSVLQKREIFPESFKVICKWERVNSESFSEISYPMKITCPH
eukprot:GHVP01044073.1.p1 GENE.GHVP01044073.1~~GHVP01044073.1.p1  ORF type:complete len:113 (+),score=18.98 GHVP01044073.1:168-506(+)